MLGKDYQDEENTIMGKSEDTSSTGTPLDFIVGMMTDEKDGKEFTLEYLKASFLSSVGRSLYYARRQAGLTQAQIAERMNTTQPVIARFEADKNGAISFHRYVDFAIACGLMPRSLVLHPILEPIASLRDEVIARAEVRRSQEPPNTGQSNSIRAFTGNGTWLVSNAASPTDRTPLSYQDVKAASETARNIVSQFQQQSRGDNATNTSMGRLTSTVGQSTVDNKKVEFAYA